MYKMHWWIQGGSTNAPRMGNPGSAPELLIDLATQGFCACRISRFHIINALMLVRGNLSRTVKVSTLWYPHSKITLSS